MTTFTQNLKLRITSDLTADARYNLNRIDLLATTLDFSNTDEVILRSREGITIQPNANDLGGAGNGGVINLGSEGQPVQDVNVFASTVNIDGLVTFCDSVTAESLKLKNDSKLDTNFVEILAPVGLTSDVSFVLPSADGATGQVLTTNGIGQLGWVSVSTNALPENHIFIGDNTSNAIQIDTTSIGQIEANTVSGLTIRSQTIVDSNISTTANINADKIDDSTSMNKFISPTDVTKLAGIEANATSDQTASEVPFTPAAGIVSTDVQSAIEEAASAGAVLSVNGEDGAVVLNIENLNNVDLNNVQNNDILVHNGTNFVNTPQPMIPTSINDFPDFDTVSNPVPPATNLNLVTDGTTFFPVIAPAPTNVLNDLFDTTITSLNDGDVLTFNGTIGQWEAQAAPSGGSTGGSSTAPSFVGWKFNGPNSDSQYEIGQFSTYGIGGNAQIDTNNFYNSSTGVFTVQPGFAGVWDLRLRETIGASANVYIQVDLLLNGSIVLASSSSTNSDLGITSDSYSADFNEIIELQEGWEISFRFLVRGPNGVTGTINAPSNSRGGFSAGIFLGSI